MVTGAEQSALLVTSGLKLLQPCHSRTHLQGRACSLKDTAPPLLGAGRAGPAAGKTLHNSFLSLLYKQVPFLILFHHNIQVMLMTQQDEKLTSLWTISPACHTPNMPSMPHTKCHMLYSYWTCTHFSLSHPPLCFPDFCKPFPVLFRDRTLVQVWARAPPCAGHGVKASSYGNLPSVSTEPTTWIHPEHTGNREEPQDQISVPQKVINQTNPKHTKKGRTNTSEGAQKRKNLFLPLGIDNVLTPINCFKSKPWAFPEMWLRGALFSCLHR